MFILSVSTLPKSFLSTRKHSTKEWKTPYVYKTKDLVKKKKRTYSVMVVKEEDGGYSGRCIEYPGAISQGETLAELRENMKEAISLVRQSYEREIVKIVSEQAKKNQLIEVVA